MMVFCGQNRTQGGLMVGGAGEKTVVLLLETGNFLCVTCCTPL